MISVLILTKNEERDIYNCLTSIKWCDDVHIYDSYSTDRTIEIAKDKGAKVAQRKFDGYASQRNAALTNVEFKYDWVLILDADETIPDHLEFELKNKVKTAESSINGFRLRRRDYFGNKWLRYSQISPFYIRLIRLGKAHYHREINEVLTVDGKVDDINDYFNHFPFSKGIYHWIDKHNEYSSMEAAQWVEEHYNGTSFSIKKALFSSDFNVRRYNQKGIFYKLPGRPLIKWFYMVFFRLAFLDGRAGLTYATLQAIYEYFIVLKTREIIHNRAEIDIKRHA